MEVAHPGEQISGELEPVGGAQELVVRVTERKLDVAREQLLAFELDAVVHHRPHRVAGGRERPPDAQEVVTQLGDPLAGTFGRPVLDVVFEIVDLLVEGVDQIQVALGDVVDEVVDDLRRRILLAAGFARGARIVGRPVAGGLAHREEQLPREDEVDLLVEDLVLLGDGDRHEQDAEDVVAVRLELGPRLVVVTDRLLELLACAVMNVGRKMLLELCRRRVEQIDPGLGTHAGRG